MRWEVNSVLLVAIIVSIGYLLYRLDRWITGESDEAEYSKGDKECMQNEVDVLKAAIEEYEDDTRKVLADECAADEKHCACVPVLRKENEKRMLYGAELAQERNDLKKENEAVKELLKMASRFNALSKTESAPAWDHDSPFQKDIDALLVD